MAQWSSEMHARVSAAIRAGRGKRSAQWLADRTADLGYPVTRAQIANYESGRKQSLDITELIVIAKALKIPPVRLLFPGPYQQLVELTPGSEVTQFEAAQWFSAHATEKIWRTLHPSAGLLASAQHERENNEELLANMRPLEAYRELEAAKSLRRDLFLEESSHENDRKIAFYDGLINRLESELAAGDA